MTQNYTPANDLERLLVGAARDPGARPEFYRGLPRHTLFALNPYKESTEGSRMAYPGETMQIGDWKRELGQEREPYIPLALAGHATMPDVRDAEVLQFLVSRGLTAIAGELTIEELARKYRVGRWHDFWDVIYTPPAPLLQKMSNRILSSTTIRFAFRPALSIAISPPCKTGIAITNWHSID